MTASMPLRDDRTIVLRRQREVRLIEGKPQGVYTNTFEIICPDCGDDPIWDYRDVPSRLQRLRGPHWIEAGAREYEAHIAWHEARATRGDGHCFASMV
jgi:hypothetical protein